MNERLVKTQAEIEIIAQGGAILARALGAAASAVRPGVRTDELNRIAEEEILRAGAEPSFKGYGQDKNRFPAALCTSVNSVVVHGVPGGEVLKEGDIVGLDLGVKYKNLYSDAAVTVPVGKISAEAAKLVRVTERALDAAIAEARAGNKIGDISAAIQKTAEEEGMNVVRELIGHGVGYAVHEDPAVPCYGRPGTGPLLQVGMVLAIEPMVVLGGYKVECAPGTWPFLTVDGSLAAHFEHTIAITGEGPRILTAD